METSAQEFSDPVQFLNTIRPLLQNAEAANGLFLGIAERLVNGNSLQSWRETSKPYQAICYAANRPVLALQRTPPFNVLVTELESEGGSDAEERSAALATAVRTASERYPDLKGVNAERSLAIAFAEQWCKANGARFYIHRDEALYELRSVVSPPPVSGHLRVATTADAELLTSWVTAFIEEAMGEAPGNDAAQMVRSRLAGQSIYVWEDSGDPVAMAMSTRPTEHGISIGFVYTPIELRGRGYASNLVASLSQRLLDSGFKFCTLFTDLANSVSNSIYQKIGYRRIGDFAEVNFLQAG